VNDKTRHAHRVIFIDLARAIAVILMVAGHTSSALLAQRYRTGPWFEAWTFQRGLTSALFLLLAGFAFSIATTRHWTTHLSLSPPMVRRLRRFATFVLLGYALHLPVRPVWGLVTATETQWRALLGVDVLQLIGVSLLAVQLLVMLTRSRRIFMLASFALAILVIGTAPMVWRTDWTSVVPASIAAYFSPATGSLFPLFPWAAYVFIGAAAGQLYSQWGAANLEGFARTAIAAGIGLLLAGVTIVNGIPGDVALRTGSCFLALGIIAYASRRISQLPHVFGAIAQESLVIYFVHLCIVYGSVWNSGLYQFYGNALSPLATIVALVAVVLAMVGLASSWNWLKHARPETARWVPVAAGVMLVGFLL
jgi:uncharacterized membrane protein